MANILTATEASNVLRTTTTDVLMLNMLPAIDAYIRNATGHDWAGDTTIREEAKSAARMLLVLWYENPAMIGGGVSTLASGLTAVLTQLEALALRYREFRGLSSSGYVSLPGVKIGDTVQSVAGIIGVTGDQAAKFETVITVDGLLKQISDDDLYDNFYRALLIPLESL